MKTTRSSARGVIGPEATVRPTRSRLARRRPGQAVSIAAVAGLLSAAAPMLGSSTASARRRGRSPTSGRSCSTCTLRCPRPRAKPTTG